MTNRGKLSDVFNECEIRKIVLFLDESYCCTYEYLENQQEETDKLGFIYAQGENTDTIMTDIVEEGSAVVEWNFEAYNTKNNNKLGKTISNIFRKFGYIVEWKKGVEIILTVIDEKDLPEEYVHRWKETNYTQDIDDEDEDRIDPDVEVAFTKTEEHQDTIFQSSDEEYEENEDEDKDKPIVDLSSDENEDSDDETVCRPDCSCVNCVAEREEDSTKELDYCS